MNPQVIRLKAAGRLPVATALALATALLALVAAASAESAAAPAQPSMAPVPKAQCGPGSLPETAQQGRAPEADFTSGRAAKGYLCNTRQIGHSGQAAGLKVFRYVDSAGHVCAYYDSTTFFPTDVPANLDKDGTGVVVLDMSDPKKPKKTANLTTPAMLTPHESLQLSHRRGLLVAVAGNAVTAPGVVEVYDVKKDCRSPQLLSSTPFGLLGHESGMSPDGRTFYVSSTLAQTVAAIGLDDPAVPQMLWATPAVFHGMSVSDDGKRLYAANIQQAPGFGGGLQILDVSQIQARVVNPSVPVVASLTWPIHSTPQMTIPITIKKNKYVIQVDEFARPNGDVGAGRIISINDERRPFVVSNIRLEANNAAGQAAGKGDPGASDSSLGGYTGHYCTVPRRDDPGLVACSYIASGLRIFDIRDPKKPREVGYFNKPPSAGSNAMSAPAWDVSKEQVWYSDSRTGFYAVQLTNGIATALRDSRPPVQGTPPKAAPPRTPAKGNLDSGSLPATGLSTSISVLAFLLVGAGAARARRRH